MRSTCSKGAPRRFQHGFTAVAGRCSRALRSAEGGNRLKFRILGPLEVLDDDGVVNVVGAKQRSVLAVLLLHPNEVVPTDRLADLLWGDETPAAAAKTVQVHVSRLRKALGGDGVLQTRGGGYLLEVGPDDVDVLHFQELAGRGRRLLARGDARAARMTLAEALSLFRGPPLAEFAYEPFAQAEIGRLEEQRDAALEDRIEADLQLGEHAGLVGELEALVAEHPLRERLRSQLMLALYRSGRQAEALEVYRRARETLVDELGIEPGRALQELEQAILRQDPELEAREQPHDAGERPGRRAAGIFVGRERELRELQSGLDDAFAGRGRLFLIAGGSGLGKTRLADELASRAKERGARVLWGRCWKAGGAPPYWPWTQAFRSFADEAPQLDGVDEATHFAVLERTASFLRTSSQRNPLLIVLDDVHAADDASLLLLEFVTGELAEMHVVIVATYAVGAPMPDAVSALTRHAAHHRLPLRPFTHDELERFLQLAEADDIDVDALHAETEGVPRNVWDRVRSP